MRLLLVLLFAPLLHAAMYVVPPDAELIQRADAIVIATGVSSFAERNERGGIVTRATLRVEETLKGEVGTHVVLTELGGRVGGRSRIVPGAPRYEPGVRYLVFLSTNRHLEPVTLGMSLGRFELDGALAVRRAVHGFDRNLEPHVERSRNARQFASFIRDVVAQRHAPPDYFEPPAQVSDAAVLQYSRNSYLLEESGIGYRWRNPAITWVRNGTQPGSDGAAAVAKGLAQWSSTDSAIDLRDGGVDPAAVAGLNPDDGKNAILFNDPDNEISDATGVVGVGGASGGEEYQYEGETFVEIVEGDIVVANQSFGQSCLDTILTHELGHTLGIRHSNDPPDALQCGVNAQCTSDAVMNSGIQCPWNGVLRGWDHNAAAIVYGDGVVCEPPVIVTQPASITVQRGALIKVSVDVAGTEPFRYAWFEGARGVTTRPVGTGARELVIAAGRAASTRFWVLVSNDCGSVESFTAAISVPVSSRTRSVRH